MAAVRSSTLAVLVSAVSVVPGSAEDFADGLAAYDAGAYEETIRLWEPLAAAGDPLAQLGLAGLYRSGEGIPRDLGRARELYRRAAAQGNTDAQINLARLLMDGDERDLVEAHAWLTLAADAGRRWARDRLPALEAEMTPGQRAAAERRRAELQAGG